MSAPRPQTLPTSRLFDAAEPVITARPLLEGASRLLMPRFGDDENWDFNSVLRRPANTPAAGYRLKFNDRLADPAWNLLARELIMILANPTHPAVLDAGLHRGTSGMEVGTLKHVLSALRCLAAWGAEHSDRLAQPGGWRVEDLRRHIADLNEDGFVPGTVTQHVVVLRYLTTAAPALSIPWPAEDPWPRLSARQVARDLRRSGVLATPPVSPEIWFPLLRAAWAYIHDFAPDVLRAHRRYRALREAATTESAGKSERLEAWLADPTSRVPVLPGRVGEDGQPVVSWASMSLLLGHEPTRQGRLFGAYSPRSKRQREAVLEAVSQGRWTCHPFGADLVEVSRPDGSSGPWHPGMFGRDLHHLRATLRGAAFVLVAALSMMRDSEIHEIERGGVVEYFNSPAIASRHIKSDPGATRMHWWITEPVAEAIAVAEAVAAHPDRIFAPINQGGRNKAANGSRMLDAFITDVNAAREWTGLEEIPSGPVRPHMFRRTMAMLADQFAGSEIALGMQLKHIATRALANTVTRAYAASDTAWADHLENAIDAARFRRIQDLFTRHQAGEPIGFGPGAERIKADFDKIADTVKAHGGDARVEADLLRRARITIRFGTLNHCLFDPANPAGASCLENATVPEGHTGPLHDRCRPDRCPNSMIGPDHLPIYDAHRRTQLQLLSQHSLPKARKALIERELARAETVLEQARKAAP